MCEICKSLHERCLGIFSDECSTFLDMMNDIGTDKKRQLYIIKKMINIAIRATYYIFCCRNRNWDNPDFFLSFFFLIIRSQAAFINCLYMARFTIVHSKTQIKFPILLLLLLLLLLSLLLLLLIFSLFLSGKTCHRKLACVSGL